MRYLLLIFSCLSLQTLAQQKSSVETTSALCAKNLQRTHTQSQSELRTSYNATARQHPFTLPATDLRATDNIHYRPTPPRVLADTSDTMKKLNKMTNFMEWYMVYFPMPFGSYSKETSLLFGLTKYNAFTLKNGDKHDSVTQASSISAFGYYTLNTQYKMVLEANIMRNKNKGIWKTDLIYVYYPLLYYGVGNDTDLNNQSTLNTTQLQFYTFYLFKTWKKWYIGPVFDYQNYTKVNLVTGPDQTREGTSMEEAVGRQTGVGMKVSMEGRDNRLNAKEGTFVDAAIQRYDKSLGSKFNYTYFQLDVRHYHTFGRKLTLAGQLRTESKQGDVPVQSLAMMGGDYFMRGSYLGRYRSNVVIDSQLELRFPLFWIFGGTLFGGVGQAAPTYKTMDIGSFHGAYGLGFRLKVDHAHDINLRFDMGFSRDQSIFIMNFTEAF